mgnify:CR=1 FL=1
MADVFQHIFNLPASCVFHTVMPKNAFEKSNALSAAEKRLIAKPFLPLQAFLRASLVQARSFIPPKQNEEMDYDDILFFSLKLKPTHLDAQSDKLIQLYQKYIPKPCVLLLYDDTRFIVNTALKKYNEADPKKRVVTEQLTTPIISIVDSENKNKNFIKSLHFEQINKQNLKTVHESYARSIINFNIVAATGKVGNAEDVSENAERLRQIVHIEKELNALRNHIRKSKNLKEKIDLKLQLKQKKQKMKNIKNSL